MRFVVVAILLAISLFVQAKTYLVTVGVADYSNYPIKFNNLTYSTADANAVVDLFSKNRSVEYSILLNKKATKKRILTAIQKLFNKAQKEDIIIFFFSGHGYAGGFCAADGNISYTEIRNAMVQSKSKNKIIFADACRAGGLRVDDKSIKSTIQSAKKANVMLFLSSRNNENSIERNDLKNGLFTTFLCDGLKGSADTNRNRTITAKELFVFVSNGVKKASRGRQHPVMWGNFKDNMPIISW